MFDGARAHRPREPDREPHPARDPRSPALPGRRRRRLSDARPQRRDAVGRRRAAHPSGDADRLEPDRRALRARRAVDRPAPARQPRAARRRWRGCATSATPWSSSSTTRRRSARADYVIDLGPGRRRARRQGDLPGHAGAAAGRRQRLADRRLPARRADASSTPTRAAPGDARRDRHQGRAREQPEGHRRRDSARRADDRHRRQRLGQVDAGQRDPLPGAGARAVSRRRRAGRAHRRSKGSISSTR